MYDKDVIVGFCAVLHQPHSVNKKIKRCSRLVILPDYQGIGLGYKFLNVVAEKYAREGFDFSIVTSAKNFIDKLYNSGRWACIRVGIAKPSNKSDAIDYNRASMRSRCKTASFMFRR